MRLIRLLPTALVASLIFPAGTQAAERDLTPRPPARAPNVTMTQSL